MQKSFRMRAVMHAAAVAGSCLAISVASAQNKNYAAENSAGSDEHGQPVMGPRGEPDINCTIGVESCQPFEYPRVAGTSQQASGAFMADQFKTAGSPGAITNLCWWGTYGVPTCGAEPPTIVDDFQLTYYANANPAVPGAVIAQFRQSAGTLTVTHRFLCDVNGRTSAEFTATHAPVTVAANTCYFLELRNFGTFPTPATGWFWSRTFGSAQTDGYCLRDADNNGYQYPAELLNDDRAWCIGTALDTFATPDCYLGGPPPPICGNPNANGQVRGNVNFGGYSNDGPNSTPGGLQLGDSVQFATSGPITNFCFWAFWVNPVDGTQPTGPATPDLNFTIYDSNGTDGLPGTVLLTGRAGTTAGFFSRRQGTNYNFTFPSFDVVAHHCYYISLSYPQDTQDPDHSLRFLWGLAQDNSISNNQMISRPGIGGPWGYFSFGAPPQPSSNASWVFDRAAETPSCGLPPPPPPPPSNDNCSSPTAIAGLGTFNFDNRGATTDGAASCDPTSGKDVWYDWTSPCAGNFTVSMCAGASFDSILSALDGGCAGPELACDDDGCGVGGGPSTIGVSAAAGQHLFIRIASFGGGTGGQGTFAISRDGGACPPNCPCNWNGDAFLNSQDFFDFLNSFFGPGGADFNHDGVSNSQDFFDFLNCFFAPPAGC